jgi:hypothetical protein
VLNSDFLSLSPVVGFTDGRPKRDAAVKAEKFFEEVRVKEEELGPEQDDLNDCWPELGFGKRLF